MHNYEGSIMRELFRLIGILAREAYEDARAYVLWLWEQIKVEINDK